MLSFLWFPSLINCINCFYWQLSRTTEPKDHRPGCAVPKRLMPPHVQLPFSLRIGSLLPMSSTLRAYFGPEAWRAPSPGQPSWHFFPCALLCSHVQTALKPDLVAGRENYISLNDTQRFVKYLLYTWHFMAVIAFIFIHKLSCVLFFPLSR